VEVDESNNVEAKHIQDYRQRPFQRIPFEVTGIETAHAITEGVLDTVRKEARVAEQGQPAPIIEITLRGQLGFPASLIETKIIRKEAEKLTGALHIRMKNVAVPVEYAVADDLPDDASRERLERRVVEDLVMRDSRFKARFANVSDAVIGAKRLALGDEEPAKIAEFISTLVE
jgi:hypothetical protein